MTADKNYEKWLQNYNSHKDKCIYGYLEMLSPKVLLVKAGDDMFYDDVDTLPNDIADTLSNVADNLTLTEVKKLVQLNVKYIYIIFFKKENIDNENCIFDSQKSFIKGNVFIFTNLYDESLYIHICY